MAVGTEEPNTPRDAHLGVLLKRQHDLGSTIPASGDIFGHETSFGSRWFCRLDRPSETEIANLEVTVGIQQQVGWLEVPMYHIGGVQGLESAQGLVDEVLGVIVRQVLCSDHAVHIGLHKLLNYCVTAFMSWVQKIDARFEG